MAVTKIKAPVKTDLSNKYYCIHSIQKLNSEFDTNVFATNIPVSQLLKNRDVILVDDLRGDARWGMNKIIQRNISAKRVEEIKSEYLEANNRAIKFFPAITVVLLPKSMGEPIKFYANASTDFDEIKGIEVIKNYEGDEFVFDYPVTLGWDKNEISALVIDGQHRVSAIRDYYDSKNENSYNNVSIPVSFVVFKNDPRLDLIQATRALFIDVNNTPRLVSEEKLIFIDDRNIHRRITSKALGTNDPGDDNDDIYQKMLNEDDFSLSNYDFINRYFIEESGRDDEDHRGFLSNHSTLFPWEISNIMTIHRNIVGGILLKYKDIDKTRDIRSICYQLNSGILEEIEDKEAVEELSEIEVETLLNRLRKSRLTENEIEVFRNIIFLKKRNLEELQQAKAEFLTGSAADEQEEKDSIESQNFLQNIYLQDCSKDSAFELSSKKVSELLKENCSVYINLLVYVYNNLWFVSDIKNSILLRNAEDRQLIFNFILSTHESLKLDGNAKRRKDKAERQIHIFIKDNDGILPEKNIILNKWVNELEGKQKINLLRTVVGQEMLFSFIVSQNTKLASIDLGNTLKSINSLGAKGFFDNNYEIELNFFEKTDFKIPDFNHWSEIIMKGATMKPGIINATKGAEFIILVTNNIVNRTNADSNLRKLDKIQKAYGTEIIRSIANNDVAKLYKMYKSANKYKGLSDYLTLSEIETIKENFANGDALTPKVINVISKLYGGIGLHQVINHFNKS